MRQIGDMISIEVAVIEETSGFFGRSKISFLYVCKKIRYVWTPPFTS